MVCRFKLSTLLQGLTLLSLVTSHEASSLGLTVHVTPLKSDGGNTVRAHFTAIAPDPCPDLSGLCSEGEDCEVYKTPLPFTGTKPNSGWCVRQWHKTVPSKYSATISLGSNTEFYVYLNAGPTVRANSGRLNQPAYVALPPPLRARVNCPHHFHLSVKDLDGDKVQCRFAREDEGECVSCPQHSFIELDKARCMLSFTGKAAAGQYFIYLVAEDFIPAPRINYITDGSALSSVPVHLSLTVEESSSSCIDEPMATGSTPEEDSVLFVLPFQEVKFTANFISQPESVAEVAVVGPPALYRTGFTSIGPLAKMDMAWVRSENNLSRLLPICFAANTQSLQSEPRCIWLYQREMRTLPAGTELKCENTEMSLVLPITSFKDIKLEELQLNSPTCPVIYNSTHLTARFSLDGCGTKAVHAGTELIFTNTLQSVRPYTMVSREPSLILPLACRIPETQVKGPQYKITLPTEKETFGEIRVWIEFHLPGEGPLSKYTRSPRFRSDFLPPVRSRRQAETESVTNSSAASNSTDGGLGSRISQLDLHLLTNCSVARAEMIVSSCIESETEDFEESTPILNQGCLASNSTLEVVTEETKSKVYRLDLSSVGTQGSTMYVQCTVNLCISTMPSQKCPDLCTRAISQRTLIGSVFTSSYTVRSGPVSLVVTTPAPTTASNTAITTTTKTSSTPAATTTTASATTTSHAPEQASSVATGVILTSISVFLQKVVLY
ncbi:uncharacterized protein LOC125005668 [Mugil cephalus]|uniref:uncharacterized protein LOC125005668 n=1 Tax=Mugil cephalus TaxID=48193 RepID=UPI001FB76841|nr:uncharacterized protein LOC125005668 [Mugil cephalus]